MSSGWPVLLRGYECSSHDRPSPQAVRYIRPGSVWCTTPRGKQTGTTHRGFLFSPICQTDRFCCCGLTQPENFPDSAYCLPFSSPLPLGYYVCEHDADFLSGRLLPLGPAERAPEPCLGTSGRWRRSHTSSEYAVSARNCAPNRFRNDSTSSPSASTNINSVISTTNLISVLLRVTSVRTCSARSPVSRPSSLKVRMSTVWLVMTRSICELPMGLFPSSRGGPIGIAVTVPGVLFLTD